MVLVLINTGVTTAFFPPVKYSLVYCLSFSSPHNRSKELNHTYTTPYHYFVCMNTASPRSIIITNDGSIVNMNGHANDVSVVGGVAVAVSTAPSFVDGHASIYPHDASFEGGDDVLSSSSSETSFAGGEHERGEPTIERFTKFRGQQQPRRQEQKQEQDDLCGGFRLFPQRPSSLLLHVNDDSDYYDDDDYDDDDDDDYDDNIEDDEKVAKADTGAVLSSPLSSCFDKQSTPLLSLRDDRRHTTATGTTNHDTLFCTPSSTTTTRRRRNKCGDSSPQSTASSSMMNLLSLSPSFSWLDKQQQQQQQQQQPYTSDRGEGEGWDDTDGRNITTPGSDLSSHPRHVVIVTTAALPWMTGTSINPVLRAAYLWQKYNDMERKQRQKRGSRSDHYENHLVEDDDDDEGEEEEGIFYDAVDDDESTENDISNTLSSPTTTDDDCADPPSSTTNTTTTSGTTTAGTTTNDDDDDNDDDNHDTGAASWSVTLVVPWLERSADRIELYGEEWVDATREHQESVIRAWVRDTAQLPDAAGRVRLVWYRARYYPVYRSIFPSQDVCQVLEHVVVSATERMVNTTNTYESIHDDPHCPVCILEEPEHLLLYRTLKQKPDAHPFQGMYTVGILHTNYKSYAAQGALGLLSEMVATSLCATVAAAYTDKLIKLSDTLQAYAPHKETVCNVHGIRQDFLNAAPPTGQGIYFIGKLLWAKGLDKLLTYQRVYSKQRLKQQQQQQATAATSTSGRSNKNDRRANSGPHYFPMDIYGSGPDQNEIEVAFCKRKKRPLPVRFCGRVDHAAIGPQYKIFINPSVTEVLCTVSIRCMVYFFFVWFGLVWFGFFGYLECGHTTNTILLAI